MNDKKKDAISADVALEPYWEAARAGRLLLKKCTDCGKAHYYPRPLCPFCMSANTEWLQASGHGSIYSWSVERRGTPPYAIAFVSLPEGPTLLTNIVDCDLDALAIGQKVQLAFETRDELPVPVFRPA
ncbi:MAG: Zn-ribbon domain-containing OB-fold protein [Gammaproteobacteria bacterium]|nr:Zn-ribbon domain-containing OB-fold protein [Gammaproteobacteria bacterium]